MASSPIFVLAAISGLALSACGGTAGGGADAVSVVKNYMTAVAAGTPTAGQQYLESKSDEKISGSTDASAYIAQHKGATWKITPLHWPNAQSTTDKACLIGQPAPSQICVVGVEVDSGGAPVYFHFSVEKRYLPDWQIINVDRVQKPDDLIPVGTEATSGS
ncbi:MAG: hypothetical protein ACYDGR_02525 [Candidatus Dormibacteria bacterium]